MKALVYEQAHTLQGFAIVLDDVSEPQPGEMDVVVAVRGRDQSR